MSGQIRPEFIRLPEPSRKGQPRSSCPYTGYSRTGLYNLCIPCKANGFRPEVPAKCDKKRGNTRGIWLIPYDALIAYLHALPTPGMVEPTSRAENSVTGEPSTGFKTSPALNTQA